MKAMILVAALCALALPPLSAQQAAAPAPAPAASTAPVRASSTALPGPRLQPEWRRFDPSVTDSSESARASNMSGGGSHTIVVSTLALILIVVIIVLLATN